MYDLNNLIIEGRLTKDAVLKYSTAGDAICNFSIANNPTNKEDKVYYFDVTVWGKQAEGINKFLLKGTHVIVEGFIKQDKWQDKDSGQNRYAINIFSRHVHLMGKPKDKNGQDESYPEPIKNDDVIPY